MLCCGNSGAYLFGLFMTPSSVEIEELRCRPYVPWDFYAADYELNSAIDLINRGFFAPEHPDLFRPLMGSLLHHDQYMVLADYRSDVSCQERVSAACRDARDWTRMSILNVARMGRFSSDRATYSCGYGERPTGGDFGPIFIDPESDGLAAGVGRSAVTPCPGANGHTRAT